MTTLGPEQLTEILQKNGVLADGRVTVVGVEKIGAEVGFLDSLARVTLTYDGANADAPRSVVVKISSTEGIYRRIGEFYNAYEREFRFYESVAPRSPIRLARCMGREIDAETGAHVLVLEDLAPLEPGNQVAGLTPDRARATLETIGRFHARWWDKPELESLTWMPGRNIQPARYRAAWPKFKEVIGPSLSKRQFALGEHLNTHIETLLAELERPPHTIVHSDFRADNLLFDDPSQAETVVVLDWQLAIRGQGIMDVARLLGGSMNTADRAAHESNLLQRWHEMLIAGGVRDYSLHQAREDYRKAVLMCLYYPVTIHEAEEAAGARGTALAHAQIERFFTAAEAVTGSPND